MFLPVCPNSSATGSAPKGRKDAGYIYTAPAEHMACIEASTFMCLCRRLVDGMCRGPTGVPLLVLLIKVGVGICYIPSTGKVIPGSMDLCSNSRSTFPSITWPHAMHARVASGSSINKTVLHLGHMYSFLFLIFLAL